MTLDGPKNQSHLLRIAPTSSQKQEGMKAEDFRYK